MIGEVIIIRNVVLAWPWSFVVLKDKTGVLSPWLSLRLESLLTLIMRPNRAHMSISLLETLMLLKCNSSQFTFCVICLLTVMCKCDMITINN